MSLTNITSKIDNIANAWEHFKSTNDLRLKELEKKGVADPLYEEQLRKVNHHIDDYQDRLTQLETIISRPDTLCSSNDLAVTGHKHAFCEYLRKGQEQNLVALEHKSLSVGSERDGGYLVTSQMSRNMITTIHEMSPVRQLASIEVISTDSLDLIEDYNELTAGWTSETAPPQDTNTPQIGRKKIAVHELYAQPKATQKLIDDAAIDIEAWLTHKLTNIFAVMENSSFISGNGEGKPKGILSYEAGKEWGKVEQINSGVKGGISADSLFNLYYALNETHAARASFIMNRTVLQQIRMLKDKNTSQYLWQPGLILGQPESLIGTKVLQVGEMPMQGDGSLSIALGDFAAGYKIVDRSGIRILRDPFTDKPFVKFYTTKRVGGAVTNYHAIKLLKLAA
jgi:HK97 family phage major capsid protein